MGATCDCGGTLRKVELKEFDFSGFAGLRVILRGIRGLRCSKCKRSTLAGETVNHLLDALPAFVLKFPQLLSPELARFLRKRMRLSQQELADAMGIHRVTVTEWESGDKTISPQHDLMLRAVAAARLGTKLRPRVLAGLLPEALGHAREKRATTHAPEPLVIDDFLKTARDSSPSKRPHR